MVIGVMVMMEYFGNITVTRNEVVLNSREKINMEDLLKDINKKSFVTGLSFSNRTIKNMKGLNLTFLECVFENVIFERCDLSNVGFRNGTVITNCVFKQCNLNGTLFFDSQIYSSKFMSCKMNRTSFYEVTELTGTLFDNCNIKDVFFPLPAFHDNKIIGKISESGFGTQREKIEKLNSDFSEAKISFVDFIRCDLSSTILPNDPNVICIHNIRERIRSAQEKIKGITDFTKKRAISIYIEDWNDEKYVDYILNLNDYKKIWDDYFDDILNCLGI